MSPKTPEPPDGEPMPVGEPMPHGGPMPYGGGHLPGAGSEHAEATTRKIGVRDLDRAKSAGEKLVMVTAYDHPSARLADAAGVDLILVGDSAAMVMLGHESTNTVTMDEMLVFTRAVARAAHRPLVVGDMPFMSYQPSDEVAVANAGRFIAEAGADAVKLEGGGAMVSRVRAISEAGIAVFGHLGLTPQSATRLGGYRAQARTADQAVALLEDALALEQAGAVGLVLEAIPAQIAADVSQRVGIPTIGIGAGADVDGQVLVWHDLLGLTPGRLPKFVRTYAQLGDMISEALTAYGKDVRSRSFPAPEHTYSIPDEDLAAYRLQAGGPRSLQAPQERADTGVE